MERFEGKTVLITGASSGLGTEFAKLLARAGADLVLTARSGQRLEELASSLRKVRDIQVNVIVADLSEQQGPKKLHDEIATAGIDVDLVINNAGFGKWGNFDSIDLDTYESMCSLNINAVIALTYLFLPRMLEKKNGGFLNLASTAAFQPVSYFAVYSATKSFVLNFSEALAEEYRSHGITITCLCPGGTESNFHNISQMDTRKLTTLEPAEKVARVGLEAFLHGRISVISGTKNYMLANSSRLAPRSVVAKITAGMFRP